MGLAVGGGMHDLTRHPPAVHFGELAMRRNAVLSLLLVASTLFAQPFTPADAVAKMTLSDGFSARCVASEPMIRQPVSISFDGTGRLWVLQFLQYPNPEGLKPVKQDQYLRTTWDKVLDPPPKGPKGLDKITICYDRDEHGVFRKSKDFVTGLNVASGFCLATDGVYVVQPPYLLFYPDKNHDDVPDGDPEVLVKGFGLDDTHSLANSLQFGPDGWLYGAAGSTSTSKIIDPSGIIKTPIEFQQGVWRYQPKTKRFELFSEGGGNTYGLDFDANGQCITGTNWGGFACLHQLPGAYYVKGFSKHGPLHNPHAYGYFDHVPYKNFKGGHVTCGGIIYDADAYPKEFRGQYIAGNLLSNAVYTHKLTPKGASFTAEHGVDLLVANDDQFRPVDLQLGPDGCVYVADWYDKRAAHLDPIDNWDKTNGRVYKIEYTKPGEPGGVSPRDMKPFDLQKMKTRELVDVLLDPNVWWRRNARQELTGRSDLATVVPKLRGYAAGSDQLAFEAFLTLASIPNGVDESTISLAIGSEHPHTRVWAARWVGDNPAQVTPTILELLLSQLEAEKNLLVVAEYACSARRLRGDHAERVITELLHHPHLTDDPWLIHLTWWAMDAHFDTQAAPLSARLWKAPVAASPLYERWVRRVLLTPKFLPEVENYIDGLPYVINRHRWAGLRGAEAALDTGVPADATAALQRRVVKFFTDTAEQKDAVQRVLAKAGHPATHKQLRETIADDTKPDAERVKAIGLAVRLPEAELLTQLTKVFASTKLDALRLAVVGGLESAGASDQLADMLSQYASLSAGVKKRLVQAALSKPKSSLVLFTRLDAGKFSKADVSVEQARAAVAFNDKQLTALVEKNFGKLSATAGEKQARIASLNTMLGREKPGDATKGKAEFTKTCGACHQLFGEGGKVGPDLTTADRKNRGSLLASVVDPSGYIRPEYVTRVVNTLDGRTLSGVISAQSPDSITLATYANDKVVQVTLPRKEVDKLSDSGLSLMPDKLLDTMSEPDIRDLFAYLMQANPASDAGGADESNPERKVVGETKDDKKKLKLALVSGSDEYKSNDSLAILQKRLEEKYPVECLPIFFTEKDTDFSKLEKLKECDAAVFFTRRLKIGDDQLKTVKTFCESGKPIVGIRTASHGFQTWLEMDSVVYGGNYRNHYKAGEKWELKATPEGDKHPILNGVKPWASEASLYRNTGAAKDITVLMTGGGKDGVEPVTWVREREVGEKKVKQRIFYTSLGHQKDFEDENFLRLMLNGVAWATEGVAK
jgi:putative membrane-bound dehydrogenase-like protein